MEEYQISANKSSLSIEVTKDFLNNHSYWGKNRTEDQIISSIENSLCFGMYVHNKQIGFARIVTDYATMYYLADVFIIPDFQKKGYGKKLIEHVIDHPKLKVFIGIPLYSISTFLI